jgi:hypothetical protein
VRLASSFASWPIPFRTIVKFACHLKRSIHQRLPINLRHSETFLRFLERSAITGIVAINGYDAIRPLPLCCHLPDNSVPSEDRDKPRPPNSSIARKSTGCRSAWCPSAIIIDLPAIMRF